MHPLVTTHDATYLTCPSIWNLANLTALGDTTCKRRLLALTWIILSEMLMSVGWERYTCDTWHSFACFTWNVTILNQNRRRSSPGTHVLPRPWTHTRMAAATVVFLTGAAPKNPPAAPVVRQPGGSHACNHDRDRTAWNVPTRSSRLVFPKSTGSRTCL